MCHALPEPSRNFLGELGERQFRGELARELLRFVVDAVDYATVVSAGARRSRAGIRAKFTTDLAASYTFMDRYTLTVGASNLFNIIRTRSRPLRATRSTP